ncbi:MAG TPA: ABC-type transport auxiliary lipoprotein family protein [Stellaceae bacterium]|nr:ABC-type transport auxiliary lipoprotein family protein [Stellaceae bacterium]
MSLLRLLAAASLLALFACTSILPHPKPPPALYRLTALAGTGAPARVVDAQLAVDRPSSSAALDTDRIVLTRGPVSLDYFADSAWTDQAPALVQTLMVDSLQNAGAIRVVARRSGELRADAVLACDLRQFEARYDGDGPPVIDVELECRLVALPGRAVLAVQRFEGTSRPATNDLPQIVAGFDTALHDALGALVPWVADTLATAKR